MDIAAIDVGGTKIVGAAVDRKGEIKTPIRVENTGLSGEFIVETCVEIFHGLSRQHEIKALAVGTGGRLDTETGIVRTAVDLYTDYVGLNIKEMLEMNCHLPVAIDNDCCMALRGELWKGGLKDYQRVAGLILGTGVGGGVAVRKKGHYLIQQAEFGHFILHPGGRECLCGQRGCAEQYLSGTSLWRRYNQLRGRTEIRSGYEFFHRVKSKDETAREILNEFVKDLAVCLISVQNLYDVEAVVIGGGLIDTRQFWWREVECQLAQKSSHVLPRLEILPARNGNQAALLGAARLGFEKLEALYETRGIEKGADCILPSHG